ncbi:PP-loop domain protein [Arcobacter nitrofigilis DSM 7299]|uniref:PP-loop domain protein n=1 Tax=Arcobacter nitrofigilis (strain ATCC 33309 / DSM 7299 / CCUG 15893 / LMG 7604 / NCTC 12251 / CI) TaxID=572480 RepID=D5UZX9_ARCNC|nr:phosphoadenosine phosphosulfate reductase family protein [Arcobacter nitrofigilis]ADG93348.1 PP-loop domain protein [Arcobacter nitrofigilis DSM 7299]
MFNTITNKNKTTYEELKQKQSWSLWKKVEHTRKRIREFVQFTNGKAYLSFSGGLDSTVLLHIARLDYPDIVAVFCNTTNEDPEILKFVRTVDNVKTLYPKMKLKEVISKYGFPFVSKKVSRSITDLRNPHKDNPNIRNLYLTGYNRKGIFAPSWKLAKKWYFLMDKEVTKFDITSICCDILKKEPMKRFQKETGLFPIVGTTADEGQDRELNYIKYGCNIYDSKKPKSRPLSIWTNQDVWDYIKINDLNYCSLYNDFVSVDGIFVKGEARTGCVACGMGCSLEDVNRFDSLKYRNPKYYKNIMSYTNNGVTFEEAFKHTFVSFSDFNTKENYLKFLNNALSDLNGCNVDFHSTPVYKEMQEKNISPLAGLTRGSKWDI